MATNGLDQLLMAFIVSPSTTITLPREEAITCLNALVTVREYDRLSDGLIELINKKKDKLATLNEMRETSDSDDLALTIENLMVEIDELVTLHNGD